MPKLGETMVGGTVMKWLAREGDRVQQDAPIVEVETDKVTVDVPAPASGKLTEICITADTWCEVGSVLAIIQGD
jgi:pyruvate/2-oxoglutarate dehydrogenase complex dihydrolipoamide acyltransferase (E2) component